MPELLTIRVWLLPETLRQLDALVRGCNEVVPEEEPLTRETLLIGSLPRWIAAEWKEEHDA